MSKLYSFDIFDTIVTRRTATPVGIFSLIENQLKNDNYSDYPLFLRENFFIIRKEAEAYTRDFKFRIYGEQEISIDDIYSVMQNNYSLTQEQVSRLINLEIDTEIKNIVPIDENIEKVKTLLGKGFKVVLISDMYHSQETLRKILVNIDSVFSSLKIYVSSECKKTKHFSDLYKFVKDTEQVEYSDWEHLGDNIYADYNVPKKLGIKAHIYNYEKPMAYESKFLSNTLESENDEYAQLMLGASKLSRLLSKNKSEVYKFASSFAGPILYGYTDWILNESIKRGIKTLYFIARDGFVLKKIADLIIKQKKLQINTKYIYGSRIAWRIPDSNNIKEYLRWMLHEYNDRLNLKFLANRLSVDVSVFEQYLGKKNINKILSAKEVTAIEKEILNNNDFLNLLVSINKEKSKLLIDYLEQEIDFNESKIAFVDLFGSGRTQDLLANIIKKVHSNDIMTFYFYRIIDNVENDVSQKICYFPSINYSHFSIELLCRNMEGQTLGYKEKDGKIVPILDQLDTSLYEKWGYDSYIDGLCDFVENIIKTERINNCSLCSLLLWQNYIRYFLFDLDKNTANVVGNIPYCDYGLEKMISECAPAYSLKYIINWILNRRKIASYTALNFISAKRSNPMYRFFFFSKKDGNMIQKIFSIKNSENRYHKIITVLGMKFSIKRRNVKYV